jgi:tRNA/rRNA methyltransferase
MLKRDFELRVVLVRSIYERNVGAASRAMANMGFHRLILVDPQCQITLEAHQAAASGQAGLQNRVIYKSWEEFYQNEPSGLRLALTARDGRGRAVRDLSETLQDVSVTSPIFQKESSEPVVVHLIFGPEDWGLSAADIELSHFCCSIPTFGDNSSLNLAQAVLLALFIVRENWGGERTQLDGQQPPRKKISAPAVFPDRTLKTWLEAMGFDLRARKINVHTVLRRMLLQNTPTPKEYMILETVLQQSLRKLNEYNHLRKVAPPSEAPSPSKE